MFRDSDYFSEEEYDIDLEEEQTPAVEPNLFD